MSNGKETSTGVDPTHSLSNANPLGEGPSNTRTEDTSNYSFKRHSLPSSSAIQSLLSSQSGEDLQERSKDSAQTHPDVASALESTRSYQYTASSSTSKPGHRYTNSTQTNQTNQTTPDQPVLVRSYSPRPENAMSSTLNEDDETERVELPPIDAFSFDGILKSIDPKVTRTIDTITQLSSGYRANLTHETDLLIEAQKSIDTQISQCDRLSTQVLKTTNSRSDKIKTEAAPFRGGRAVEELAHSAENAYAMVENIIATLQAIDEMLPSQDQLAAVDSPHRSHYPYTHSLLSSKATENRRQSQAPAIASTSSSQPGPSASSSSASPSSHTVVGQGISRSHQHRQSPLIQYNYPPLSVQQRRLSSPPNMPLKTIMPSPSPDANPPPIATSTVASPSPLGSNRFPRSVAGSTRAVRARDGASLAPSAALSTRSSFSFKNILWGSSWRRGSYSSVGGASNQGSQSGETAEERLRRIMGNQPANSGTPDAN